MNTKQGINDYGITSNARKGKFFKLKLENRGTDRSLSVWKVSAESRSENVKLKTFVRI